MDVGLFRFVNYVSIVQADDNISYANMIVAFLLRVRPTETQYRQSIRE